MKKIKSWICALLLVATVGGTTLVASAPINASAACVDSTFLGIPSWSNGLTEEVNGDCSVVSPSKYSGGLQSFLWRIALNVINIAIAAVGYASVGFILYGGLILIKGISGVSPGSPEIAAKARKTILDACIGLVIAISSVSIINFISQIYTGDGNIGSGVAFSIPLWDAEHVVNSILNIFYFTVGIVAVIIIIISGYMFTIAGSEPSTLARAKNMIYYAVIGLAVDFFAFAITHFIIGRLG